VGQENIRPKSVAREMFEGFFSFSEYVKEYELERAEGLLLRYLSDVYKALVQTVPALAKDEGVVEIITYFGAIVRQVDSSLLDEWERMRGVVPSPFEPRPARPAPDTFDITRDPKELTVLVRNALYRLLRALAQKNWQMAAELTSASEDWPPGRFEESLAPFFAEHERIRLDPTARSPMTTLISQHETSWDVKQIVTDPEDDNDWVIECRVDLDATRAAAAPVIEVLRIGT
jgi:hypothetical protein